MSVEKITLDIPEALYRRLANTAAATKQPLAEVILRALQVGSPPAWDDAPPEFQPDLAAMDALDDDALCDIARARRTRAEMEHHDELLERNQGGALTPAERQELTTLRAEADTFVLRKAHAAVLLRWRGRDLVLP